MHKPAATVPFSPDAYQWPLYRYACFCAGSVAFLIALGGMVTSTNSGMSVPDYPTTYNYNMFLFPWQQWVGGVFWEHLHRLVASSVGLFTLVLAVTIWWTQKRVWLQRLGWAALVLVIIQGLIGGFRVLLNLDWMGIPHALISHGYLGLMALIALFCSQWWLESRRGSGAVPRGLTTTLIIVTAMIYTQLLMGATMRAQHTTLSIHDFPTAYGQVWPHVDHASIEQYNRERLANGDAPTTAFQIHLQLTHRVMAVLILLGILYNSGRILLQTDVAWPLRLGAICWIGLVFTQFTLGMYVIWTNKAAEVATCHAAVGALTLMTGFLLIAISWRLSPVRKPELARVRTGAT